MFLRPQRPPGIFTDTAPAPIGPYSQAVRVNDTLYVCGQLGIDPRTRTLVESGDASQMRQAMTNVAAILAAGYSLADVVQTQILLSTMDDWGVVNGIYSSFFAAVPPARAVVEVTGLPLDAKVEVVVVAIRGKYRAGTH